MFDTPWCPGKPPASAHLIQSHAYLSACISRYHGHARIASLSHAEQCHDSLPPSGHLRYALAGLCLGNSSMRHCCPGNPSSPLSATAPCPCSPHSETRRSSLPPSGCRRHALAGRTGLSAHVRPVHTGGVCVCVCVCVCV
eukprot:1136707-Pelagomonas_calceolata.AAC.9